MSQACSWPGPLIGSGRSQSERHWALAGSNSSECCSLKALSWHSVGAVAGTLLSLWLMHTLDVIVLPGAGALNLALEADLSLAAYTLLLLIVTGLLCGIVPSWRATKGNVVAAIHW